MDAINQHTAVETLLESPLEMTDKQYALLMSQVNWHTFSCDVDELSLGVCVS